MFSADAHALATIAPNSRLLADRFSGFPNAEGEGYPGLTIVAFALVGAWLCGMTRILRGDVVEDAARMARARARDRHRPVLAGSVDGSGRGISSTAASISRRLAAA